MTFKKPFASALFALAVLNLSACQHLPSNPHLIKSELLSQELHTLKPTLTIPDNTLLRAISHDASSHLDESGYFPIITGADAFATRSILTNQASHSIDVQYYIWHDDEVGQLMLKDLYNAANRGVKVRLLLDDLNTKSHLDQQLLSFAQHPNVAVRLINPKRFRKFSPLNYVTELPRFGRRMHNKSMTFDEQLSIIGGRNIGDEYLRSDHKNQFADLDVLLAGKVVKAINNSFEQYWNSPLAYDISVLVKPSKTTSPFLGTLDKITANSTHTKLLSNASLYKEAIANSTINTDILAHRIPFRWTMIEFLSDDPKKLQNRAPAQSYLVYKLRETMGEPKQAFTLISSYFVPDTQGVAELVTLANKGVKVKILTNSFSATDVGIVHSGYSETRMPLLKAGIELYELKTSARIAYPQTAFPLTKTLTQKKEVLKGKWFSKIDKHRSNHSFPKRTSNKQPKPIKPQKRSLLSPTKITTSLHTKAFAVDDNKVFIGSYNVDPRSANLNTELGVVIYDSELAHQFHTAVGKNLLAQAYQVTLAADNTLKWQTLPLSNDQDNPNSHLIDLKTESQEPQMSLVNRIWVKVFSFLPIKWLL